MNAEERIKNAVENNRVVLFMKGTPQFPQCGFSSRVVEILQVCEAEFEAVNVLSDSEVRESIKSYSNWPTIPQVYIDGQFVGGCDILMSMFKSGDLQNLLNASN